MDMPGHSTDFLGCYPVWAGLDPDRSAGPIHQSLYWDQCVSVHPWDGAGQPVRSLLLAAGPLNLRKLAALVSPSLSFICSLLE